MDAWNAWNAWITTPNVWRLAGLCFGRVGGGGLIIANINEALKCKPSAHSFNIILHFRSHCVRQVEEQEDSHSEADTH